MIHGGEGTKDALYYPLPDTIRGLRAQLTDLDNVEIDILRQGGARLLSLSSDGSLLLCLLSTGVDSCDSIETTRNPPLYYFCRRSCLPAQECAQILN